MVQLRAFSAHSSFESKAGSCAYLKYHDKHLKLEVVSISVGSVGMLVLVIMMDFSMWLFSLLSHLRLFRLY